MIQTSRSELINPDLIIGIGYGSRKHPPSKEDQESFERSISGGVMSAIAVCDIPDSNEKELIYGRRRRDASKKGKLANVKVDCYPASLSRAEKMAMAFQENKQRGDLAPDEIGDQVFTLYEELNRNVAAVANLLNTTEQVVKDWMDARHIFEFAPDIEERDIPIAALLKRKIAPSRWNEAWKAVRNLERGQARKVIREMSKNATADANQVVDRVREGKAGTSIYVQIEDGLLHDAIKKACIDEHKTKAEYLLDLAKTDAIRRKYYSNGNGNDKKKGAEVVTVPHTSSPLSPS